MTKYPLVSVITPSYNQAEFIEDTINSVLNQTYKHIEYIIIDGNSKDGTNEILRKYSSRVNKILIEDDKGQSDALKKGFSMAKGEILCWLCSDDMFYDDTIEKIVNVFVSNKKLDIVYGDTEYLYPNGQKTLKKKIRYSYPAMLYAYNFFAQPSTFFTSKIYEKSGGIDTSLHYVMDYDLFLKFGPKVKTFLIKESLSIYRLHKNSKTVSLKNKFIDEWLTVRARLLNRKLTIKDTFLSYFYTLIVVLKFLFERGELKIKYDNKKYIL